MPCICNLYIKAMMRSADIVRSILCLFILAAVSASSCNKKKHVRKIIFNDDLIQVRNTRRGTVCIQLIPAAWYGTIKKDVYNIRITLKSNQPIQPALLQYMDAGIKKNFRAVQDGDTLTCLVCERIPGIIANDFLYMTSYKIPTGNNGSNLRIYITDTIAGFGVTAFEIKSR